MHDHSTRAKRSRHQRRGTCAAALVAGIFSVSLLLNPAPARTAQPEDLEVSSAPLAASLGAEANPGHDIAIEIVAPGREGLELSARLTDDGGLIDLPIEWTIRDMGGTAIYSTFAPGADLSVPPGDYAVDIRYGNVRLSSTVTLLEANRLMVSFVLNAGGLRVLPRVKDMGLPNAPAISRVFALGGRQNGKLVAASQIPGEVLRLPEGDYRVESRFAAGNAAAVTDVHVKAGRMSAVDIDHKAGVARLSFVGSPQADVLWDVADDQGTPVATASGLAADVVLLPGTYTASARIGSETLSATFAISQGEARDILLGN
jgi:hypothetical protein